MHYLSELAGKLVTAYQDRDNLTHWVSRNSTESNRLILVETLREVLEQEVANGNLRYNRLPRAGFPPSEDVYPDILAS